MVEDTPAVSMTMEEEEMDPRINQHIQHEQSDDRQRERLEAMRMVEEGREPWREHEGVMAVVAAVRDEEFPCSFEQLRADVGDREVRTTGREAETMDEVLGVIGSKVDPMKDPLYKGEKVPSLRDFQDIVQRHWEAVRFHDTDEEQRPPKGGAGPQNPRNRR